MAVSPMTRAGGQVLVFYALVLPLVLVPIVAYAVDSTALQVRQAALQGATVTAVESVAQRIDIAALRSSGSLQIDSRGVRAAVATALAGEEPDATVEAVRVNGPTITVEAEERMVLPLPLFERSVALRATATARILRGYASPSSFLPFSTVTF